MLALTRKFSLQKHLLYGVDRAVDKEKVLIKETTTSTKSYYNSADVRQASANFTRKCSTVWYFQFQT